MPSRDDPRTTRTAAHPDADSVASLGGRETRRAPADPPGAAAAAPFGPPAADGEVGTLGPYRVLRPLGKGGMGVVYLATDTRLERELALKVMLPEVAADAASRERFLREARATAKVSHDNVVSVFEADERGVPYIAMPFLLGEPLDQHLKRNGAPGGLHILRIAAETAAGLAAAHEKGLIHRDIKPANLWLEAPSGRVKILDFGLARPVAAASELTQTGAVIGTPAYMSPEQARGEKVDHRTDLWSLGVVLYQLCTGVRPFRGSNTMETLLALATDEPTPVGELNPQVPRDLAALIHQLLAKDANRRVQSAAEVERRCRVILDRLSGTATASRAAASAPADVFAGLDETQVDPDPVAPERQPAAGRGPLLVAVGLTALLVAAAVGVVLAVRNSDREPQRAAAPTPAPEPTAVPVRVPPVVPKGPTEAEKAEAEKAAAAERAALAEQYQRRGVDFHHGRNGVKKDFFQAREWFLKAAQLGSTWGQYNYAYLCQMGLGGPSDTVAAREWFARSRPGLEKMADDGDALAQNSLGYMYLNGFGVRLDYAAARPLFEKAAAGGNYMGWLNLGHLYHYGHAVEQDYAKAAELYRLAAAHDEPISQYRLGLLHERGDGVKKDLAAARAWYTKAVANGSDDAQKALERLNAR
jgi:serine/threonine protein kinase/TPR repeat protein